MRFRFAKVNPNAIAPKRAHATDAGMDFYVPNDFEPLTLRSGESCMINSGIKVEIPFGYMGMFCNKSGIASKKNIIFGAHIIDSYYTGDVIINLHNIGLTDQLISPGDKIIQMVLVPVVPTVPDEVDADRLYEGLYMDDIRGDKGFGATGGK